jgi:anti-sigma-K factor RskA
MTDRVHIEQEDLAFYAMQSLPITEAESVRSHLSGCAACTAELAALAGDLALVGLGIEQHPLPEGARQRFLDKIAAEAPPVQRSALPSVTSIASRSSISGGKSGRGSGFWTPWLIAAALALVAIALGIQNRALNEEIHDEATIVTNLAGKAARAQQVLEVLTSPRAQRVTLLPGKTAQEPSGNAIYLPDLGGLIFQASNLKPLPEDKTYELWIIPANGKPPVPAGLFRPDAFGSASVILPELPVDLPAKAFGVTVEKASGSDAPSPPILLLGATAGS